MPESADVYATWSLTLVYSAILVYVVAAVLFALDLSSLRGVPAQDAMPRRRAAGIAMSLTYLAFALHLVALVLRGLAVGRAPWANMYEFTLTGALVATGVFLGVNLVKDIRYLGVFVTGIVSIMLVVAAQVFYAEAAVLPPALQSYWLVIHVSIATASVGVFTVAFGASVLQLAKDRDERRHSDGSGRWSGLFGRLPSVTALERLAFRLNAVAFVGWTFTVVAGAVWAEQAWGRYWGWDSKEVWSFVIWVVYAAYLHARATRGWRGRRAAYVALVGYACIIFNFVVVNLFFFSKHSYAGVG